MRPAPFEYVRPGSLTEALGVLAAGDGAAKAIAGGQSLMPMLNLRLARLDQVVDLGALPGLADVTAENGTVRLGPLVTHTAIEDGAVRTAAGAGLARVAAGLGYRPIRNRGTIGGSLCHADTRAEWPIVMAALDAEFTLVSAAGARSVRAGEFVVGPFTTVLADDEILREITFAVEPGAMFGFAKLTKKVGEFADAVGAAVARRDGADWLSARAFLGGVAAEPVRLDVTLPVADVSSASDTHFAELAAAALPAGHDRYRVQLAGVALRRALADALAQHQEGRL